MKKCLIGFGIHKSEIFIFKATEKYFINLIWWPVALRNDLHHIDLAMKDEII